MTAAKTYKPLYDLLWAAFNITFATGINPIMQSNLRRAIITLSLVSLLQPACATSLEFDKAMLLYNQHKFDDALKGFVDATTKDGRDSQAYMYGANCLYALGRKDDAIGCYWYLVKNFPSARDAYSAREFLKRIDVNYIRNANNPAAAKLPTIEGHGEKTPVASALSAALRKDEVINRLVTTIRANAGRPDISKALISNIKTTLSSYPMNLLMLLHKNGCKVCLTPTLIDKEPGLQNTKPRGYEDGTTYKNCPGMFDGDIVICEYAAQNVDDWEPTEDPCGTLRHEIGHAFDSFAGGISRNEKFKHAFYLDCGNLDDETKNRLSYYVQKAQGGPSECFAELVAFKFGGRTKNERCALLHASFPEAAKVVDAELARAQ